MSARLADIILWTPAVYTIGKGVGSREQRPSDQIFCDDSKQTAAKSALATQWRARR